jgi:purine-binding chemotaxis protein CheW
VSAGDATDAVLRARARALAKVAAEVRPVEAPVELLLFDAAGARYGIESAWVMGVTRLGPLTRIPDVPPFVAGVTNCRGEISMVVDLSCLLGLPATPPPPGALLLVLGAKDVEPITLIADAVHETVTLPLAELHAPDGGPDHGAGRRLRRAVTTGGCLIVDGRALLDDARLFPHRSSDTNPHERIT